MLLIIFQELNVMGFHVYDIFWVKYLFWKHQQHVSNFLIFQHFLVLAIVENQQLLNSCIWQLHKQLTSGRMECVAISVLINSYSISLAFLAPALMICWAHEKPRNNHKKNCLEGARTLKQDLHHQ